MDCLGILTATLIYDFHRDLNNQLIFPAIHSVTHYCHISIWKSTCTIAQYNISRTFSQLFVGVIAWFVSITLGTKRCWRDYLYFSKTILANNLTLLTIKMPKYHDWHLSMSRNRKTIASLPATPLADLSLTTGIYRNRRNRRKSTSVY